MGTDCTGDFSWEKAIEKTILRVLGSSEFSHSLLEPGPIARGLLASALALETFFKNERRGVWVPALRRSVKNAAPRP